MYGIYQAGRTISNREAYEGVSKVLCAGGEELYHEIAGNRLADDSETSSPTMAMINIQYRPD